MSNLVRLTSQKVDDKNDDIQLSSVDNQQDGMTNGKKCSNVVLFSNKLLPSVLQNPYLFVGTYASKSTGDSVSQTF